MACTPPIHCWCTHTAAMSHWAISMYRMCKQYALLLWQCMHAICVQHANVSPMWTDLRYSIQRPTKKILVVIMNFQICIRASIVWCCSSSACILCTEVNTLLTYLLYNWTLMKKPLHPEYDDMIRCGPVVFVQTIESIWCLVHEKYQ